MPSVPPPTPPPLPNDNVPEGDGNESGGESVESGEPEFAFGEDVEAELAAFADSDSEVEEERPVIPSLVEGDEEISGRSDVAAILKILDERIQLNGANANNAPYNPVKILTRLSEIIEFETLEYLKMDPDPFDDRHPSRTHPDCSLGHSLKALFKKETFMTKLVHEYMKENWGEGLDLEINTAACRLFVNILPGLETSVVYQETEGLILKLFTWAENAPEPLKSYSLGLLGASMEVPEIAGKFKEKNIHLVQLMLQRLRDLQNEFFIANRNALSRPFSQFSSFSDLKMESPSLESLMNGQMVDPIANQILSIATAKRSNGHHHHEIDGVDSGLLLSNSSPLQKVKPPNSLPEIKITSDNEPPVINSTPTPQTPKTPGPGGGNVGVQTPTSSTPRSAKKGKAVGSGMKHFLEPSLQNKSKRRKMANISVGDTEIDECSTSSSWAELEPNIIGSWQVFPVNLVTRQIFTLRYLAPLGEYQEMLGYAFELNAIQIILRYLSKSHQTKETSRLTFEALKYLGALLCHKKFALEFLHAGGLQKLLQVPRPSLSATGVSLCLYYIAYSEDAMEKVCLMSRNTLQNLISYVIWLLECAHNSGRNHAIMFFGVIYPFKTMLDIFDAQDGLRAVLNVITTQPSFVRMRRSIDGGQRDQLGTTANNFLENAEDDVNLSDEEQMISRQSVRQVSFNLKRYFECHLGFTSDKLKRTIGKNHSHTSSHVSGPILPPYKALKPFTSLELTGLHNTVLDLLPESAQRWAPVDRFLNQSGLETVMQTMAMAYEWNYSGRGETVRNMLDVLAVACLIPRTQLMLTERYKINGSNEHSGMSIILSAAEGEVVNEPDVKKSALQVIGNCGCGPIHHKKPTDTQIKIWECTRINNGILILTKLLQTKSPITDADNIRAMACWCLSGLARYKHVRQVLQQLPLIRSGLIQNLMTEPILQDKRHDHAMFQKYAMEIIKLVHGKEDNFILDFGDVIRKSDLISQSKVDYHENDLTELIHDHLVKAGLSETAAVLQMEAKSRHNYKINSSAPAAPINLDKIVRQYLLNQHSLCKTPMITCPTFELLKPHKCPSKSDRPRVSDFRTMGTNFGSRFFKRAMGGGSGGHEDRKLIYSRFKPFRVLRSADITGDEEMSFTTCAFSPCYQWTIVGTSNGDVKLFNNTNLNEDGTYPCHESEIYHVQANNKCSLLLTSNIWRRPLSALWKMEGLFDKVIAFDREEYVEFSKHIQDKVITTNSDTASVYDIETQKKVMTLKPRMSNQYLKNRATFDPNDELIMSDGVLWDFKSGKEVHKFDKLNDNLSGVFNPKNGLEIISNTEIWDVRTFHLLKTVRQLDQCQLTFTNDGNIIYGVKIEREDHPNGDGTVSFRHADTSFVVIDNLDDYSSIATIELKRHIMALATSPNDLQLALIENHTAPDETLSTPDSCVRFYEIGRNRADELTNADGVEDEDDVQSDDDEDVDDDDDDDDDDDGMGDDDDSNDDEDDDGDRDNDLDRLLDHLLEPNRQLFLNHDEEHGEEEESSGSSWNDEDDEEEEEDEASTDSSSDDNESDS